MPAYISHAIMGEQLYNQANRESDILKIPISKEQFRSFSLGADLACLSKRVINDPHDFDTRTFFLSMVKYIKDNQLIENSGVMALLYGHIAHYFLDINTHPLIYYIECGCKRVGAFSNHDLVEGYLSFYLSEKILGKNISEINSDYFNQLNLSDMEICKILNSVYGKVYGDFEIVKSYRKVLNAFSTLEAFIKSGLISQKTLIALSQFNDFLKKNHLTLSELTNENHELFTNPVTGENHNESFMDLYNISIEMALHAIIKVNGYLYDNASILELEKVFSDLSYNTGVSCSLGKQMTCVRRK